MSELREVLQVLPIIVLIWAVINLKNKVDELESKNEDHH